MVGPVVLGPTGRFDGVGGGVGTTACDDRQLAGSELGGDRDQAVLLLVGERRTLTSGPDGDQTVDAQIDLTLHQRLERFKVDAAVRVERGDQSGVHTL